MPVLIPFDGCNPKSVVIMDAPLLIHHAVTCSRKVKLMTKAKEIEVPNT